jgi:two-component system response regulator
MNTSHSRLSRVPTLLLVEDLHDDVFFFNLALKRAGLNATLHVAVDGTEAVDYLTNKGKFSDPALCPRPDIIFLDLKMPNMNGFEVLEWIRNNPVEPPLKVVILTGSEEPADKIRAQKLGAMAYLIKPPSPAKLMTFFEPFLSPLGAESATPM